MSKGAADKKITVTVPKQKDTALTQFKVNEKARPELAAWEFANWATLLPFQDEKILTDEDLSNFKTGYAPVMRARVEYPELGKTVILYLQALAKAIWPELQKVAAAVLTTAFWAYHATQPLRGIDYQMVWQMFSRLFPTVTEEIVGYYLVRIPSPIAEPLQRIVSREKSFAWEHLAQCELERQMKEDLAAATAATLPVAATPAAARAVVAAVEEVKTREQEEDERVERMAAAIVRQALPELAKYNPGRRGGRYGGAPRRSLADYFAGRQQQGPACSRCGLKKHTGLCVVQPTPGGVCYYCKNQGHRFSSCDHEGARQARTNVGRNDFQRAMRQEQSAAEQQAAAPAEKVGAVGGGDAQRVFQPLQMKIFLGEKGEHEVASACADSGATRVCIELGLLRKAYPEANIQPWAKGKVSTFSGEMASAPVGEVEIPIWFTQDGRVKHTVCALVFHRLFTPLIIGIDALTAMEAHIRLGLVSSIEVQGVVIPVQPFVVKSTATRLYTCGAVKLRRGLQMVPCTFHGSFPSGDARLIPREFNSRVSASAAMYMVSGPRKVDVCVYSPYDTSLRKRAWVGALATVADHTMTIAGMQWPRKREVQVEADGASMGAEQIKEDVVAAMVMAAASTAHIPEEQEKETWAAILERLKKAEPTLSEHMREQLEALFWKHRAVFVTQLKLAGEANIPPFEIRLQPGAVPAYSGSRRTGPREAELMGKELDTLLAIKAVRPAGPTAFSAPMMLVPKPNSPEGPDGQREWRVVIDYRGLNAITEREVYPLPDRRDVLDRMGTAKWFTCFDLAMGYFQQPIAEADTAKTAFSVPGRGMYEWLVTAMGLTNAPPNFQRSMEVVLSGLTWECCLVFIDDIIVFSATWEKHLQDVDAVLTRFAAAGLKVKIAKSQIASSSVKFLGAVISGEGVRPDPARVEAIRTAGAPRSVSELRTWLGLCTWLRPFGGIDFANAVQPLYDALKKGKQWSWTPECAQANDMVKKLLTSAPVLVHPDFSKKFVVYVDASDKGWGGILFQEQASGVGGVVAYASGKWSEAESKYSVSEMETLALVNLSREWRPYLFGSPFKVLIRSDHQALAGIVRSTRRDHGRFDRMRDELQAFSYDITYIPGPKNPADALTRAPVLIAQFSLVVDVDGHARAITTKKDAVVWEAVNIVPLVQVATVEPICVAAVPFEKLTTLAELAQAQREDEALVPFFAYLDRGVAPVGASEGETKILVDLAGRMGYSKEKVLLIHANVPQQGQELRGEGASAQIVVPVAYQASLLQAFHEREGHLKAGRMFETMRRGYWWPKLRQNVDSWCDRCEPCQLADRNVRTRKFGELHPIRAEWPFQLVAMDVADCGEGDEGYRYFVVMVDLFTRWVEGVMLKETSTRAIKDAFHREWVCRHGQPHVLLTDNGSNFASDEMKVYTQENKILHHFTTPYNPEENGAAEHAVKMLKAAIRTSVAGHQKDWPRQFHVALRQQRLAVNEAIGMSPYFALYGRAMGTAVPLPLRPLRSSITGRQLLQQRATAQLQTEAELVQQQGKQKEKQKKYYDQQHMQVTFKLGDRVLKRKQQSQPGEVRALEDAWDGPFEVTGVSHSNKVTLRALANPGDIRDAAVNQLKYYLERDDQQQPPPAAPQHMNDFEVEDIWLEAPLGDGVQYLVKWKGFSPKHMTWQREETFSSGNTVLLRFKERAREDRQRPPKGKSIPKSVLKKKIPEQADDEESISEALPAGVATRIGRKIKTPMRWLNHFALLQHLEEPNGSGRM